MNRSSSKIDANTESDHVFPPPKRRRQSQNSQQCLSNQSSCVFIDLTSSNPQTNIDDCKSCGKQETLLKTFNCPSLHYFCLNCIFNWTQKHIQSKTPPICSVGNCGYLLKIEDLDDLPIAIKDHQILLQLIELKISDNKTSNLRLKCDKCDLYIDQHNFFIHHNECLGRALTIPCEICFCPVLINDYEEHMLICTNDDNSTVSQFLLKHLRNPNIDEKNIKLFVCSWQRKHRQSIDIYEMIEELNQTNVSSNDMCDMCKNIVRSDEFYVVNCGNNHSLCLLCYKQHVQNQMHNNQILTCHQCAYHLQDKDLSEIRVFNNEEVFLFQNYQNKQVLELYSSLYGTEDTFDINPTIQQQNGTSTTTTTYSDDTPRRKCELCSKQHSYGDIFVLNCDCKICYDCFANEVNRQQTATNEILICSLCRSPIKHSDLANLRLRPAEIQMIQLYQQGKLFEREHAVHFNKQKNNQITDDNDDDFDLLVVNQQQCLPKYWTLPMLTNFSRHPLEIQSTEYKFVADKFHRSWANIRNQFTVPAPPPPAPSMPIGPLPPTPTVLVPATNNPPLPPPPPFQPGFLPQFGLMPVSVNNNNGAPINQPPPSLPNHGFRPSPYSIPHRKNPKVPPPMPSLPGPFPLQQIYGSTVSHSPTNLQNHLVSHIISRARRTRPVISGDEPPKIIQIERIQNQRWYKQYSAHECEFRQKLGKQTEQWLFHGCNERSSKNIEMECFNRSYAGQHAVAFGQGCYFARDSLYSHSYALPDRNGVRRMFLARVLVGNTAQGNSTMRVAPSGFDTTGDGHSIFVTYHDSQAYAEYLISYR